MSGIVLNEVPKVQVTFQLDCEEPNHPLIKVAIQILATPKSDNLSLVEKKITNRFLYRFPENSIMTLSKGRIDLSNIEVNLRDIFIGGIGYGGGASKLMARTMNTIGNGKTLFNLPFCVEGFPNLPEPYNKMLMISTENTETPKETVQKAIEDAIKGGFTHINIPLNVSGHASLATLVIANDKCVLRFYDSFSSKIIAYDKRYGKELISYLQSFLPSTLLLEDSKAEVLHLLDQGGEDSQGCGYYTLFTALLLKENEELRNLTSFEGVPLFDEHQDQRIRADLVVRTLIDYGLENVDTSWNALVSQLRNSIFNRINDAVVPLIKALEPRLFQAR